MSLSFKSSQKSNGFTLIELMITIAIAAILMAVAAPSFVSLFEGGDVDSELSELKSSVAFLRSEALKTGKKAALCASTDGLTCTNHSDRWNQGYLGFVCNGGNDCSAPATSNHDTIVLINDTISTDSFVAFSNISATTPTDTLVVTFNNDGAISENIIFALCANDSDNDNAKQLDILPSGQSFSHTLASSFKDCSA